MKKGTIKAYFGRKVGDYCPRHNITSQWITPEQANRNLDQRKNDNENQIHKRNMELLQYEFRVKEAEYNYQLKAELIKAAQKRPEVASEIVEAISQRISQPEYIVSDEYTKYLEGTTNGQVNIDNKRNGEIIQMPTKGRKE